jgi:hypothetical protein
VQGAPFWTEPLPVAAAEPIPEPDAVQGAPFWTEPLPVAVAQPIPEPEAVKGAPFWTEPLPAVVAAPRPPPDLAQSAPLRTEPLPRAPEPPAVRIAQAPPPPPLPAARPQAATPPAPAPRPQMNPALRDAMLRRGEALAALGDISGARRFLERAAEGGSAAAAMAMAETYDPRALARLGVIGLTPDPAAALTWYRRALALGAPDAADRIATIEAPR